MPNTAAPTDGDTLSRIRALMCEAAHAASGELSDCRFLQDPGAVCVDGTCRLKQPGAGGQPAV